jgi:hypothetical protein
MKNSYEWNILFDRIDDFLLGDSILHYFKVARHSFHTVAHWLGFSNNDYLLCVEDRKDSMKHDLAACRCCGYQAERGWMMMDEVWSSYYIGCSNDLCDAMVSMEVRSDGKTFRMKVEQVVKQAWNEVNNAH